MPSNDHFHRTEMPYVFEVPTTLEALHDVIGSYAETGTDACTIIQRIHASNSVRLDKNNKDKMQNFYDVVLRRFIGVCFMIVTCSFHTATIFSIY